jgi:hypothetical protein
MLEILQNFVNVLTAAPTVTAIVGTNIFVGPVDIVMEKQSELLYPQITMFVVSEVQRSNPLNTRDTHVQIDLWSRNSQLEIENLYEAVIAALSYETTNQNTAHIFWQRLGGATDLNEGGTKRTWHRAITFVCWSVK